MNCPICGASDSRAMVMDATFFDCGTKWSTRGQSYIRVNCDPPFNTGLPIDLKPVLAKIEKSGCLGTSTFHSVVFHDGENDKWSSYAGDDTFKNDEYGYRVLDWRYVEECFESTVIPNRFVDINKLRRVKAYLNSINAEHLEDIRWLEDGNLVNIPKEYIDEFKYVGLNNTEFIMCGCYKEGIKIEEQ